MPDQYVVQDNEIDPEIAFHNAKRKVHFEHEQLSFKAGFERSQHIFTTEQPEPIVINKRNSKSRSRSASAKKKQ